MRKPIDIQRTLKFSNGTIRLSADCKFHHSGLGQASDHAFTLRRASSKALLHDTVAAFQHFSCISISVTQKLKRSY